MTSRRYCQWRCHGAWCEGKLLAGSPLDDKPQELFNPSSLPLVQRYLPGNGISSIDDSHNRIGSLVHYQIRSQSRTPTCSPDSESCWGSYLKYRKRCLCALWNLGAGAAATFLRPKATSFSPSTYFGVSENCTQKMAVFIEEPHDQPQKIRLFPDFFSEQLPTALVTLLQPAGSAGCQGRFGGFGLGR